MASPGYTTSNTRNSEIHNVGRDQSWSARDINVYVSHYHFYTGLQSRSPASEPNLHDPSIRLPGLNVSYSLDTNEEPSSEVTRERNQGRAENGTRVQVQEGAVNGRHTRTVSDYLATSVWI